jgi:hypothetical protein
VGLEKLRKKTFLRIFSVIAFFLIICCSLILPILGLTGSETISSYGAIGYPTIVEKEVIWNDDSTESIKVDEKGQVFLNGRQTVAFGLNIVTIRSSDAHITAIKVLDTLQGYGIRFMALDISSWLTIEQGLNWIKGWMPLLQERKMWVALYIQHGEEPPILDVNLAFQRISSIIDGITNQTWANMIFLVGYNWELDLGEFGNTAAQLETFLSQLYPLVKEKLNSSIIGKVALVGKNNGGWPDIVARIVKYSDIPNYDYYLKAPWKEDCELKLDKFTNEILPLAGKPGNMTIWLSENGYWPDGNDYYTVEMLQYLLTGAGHYNIGGLFFWMLQDWSETSSLYKFAAFDMDGNPKQWFQNLAPYFPRSQ